MKLQDAGGFSLQVVHVRGKSTRGTLATIVTGEF